MYTENHWSFVLYNVTILLGTISYFCFDQKEKKAKPQQSSAILTMCIAEAAGAVSLKLAATAKNNWTNKLQLPRNCRLNQQHPLFKV